MYSTMSKEHFYFIVTTSDHGNLYYTCMHYVIFREHYVVPYAV